MLATAGALAVLAGCGGSAGGAGAEVSATATATPAPTTAAPDLTATSTPTDSVIADPPCPPPAQVLALAERRAGRVLAGPACEGPWAAALISVAGGQQRLVLRRAGFEYRVVDLAPRGSGCGPRLARLPAALRDLVACP